MGRKLLRLGSQSFPYLRVDLVRGRLPTVLRRNDIHPGGGYERTLPYEWDIALGKRLMLPARPA